jgi:hypothetical protein
VEIQLFECYGVEIQLFECYGVDIQLFECYGVDIQLFECYGVEIQLFECYGVEIQLFECYGVEIQLSWNLWRFNARSDGNLEVVVLLRRRSEGGMKNFVTEDAFVVKFGKILP